VDGNLCPRAVADIGSWVLYEKPGDDLYCIGSIEQDRFIAVPESKVRLVLEIVTFFDGLHSIDWIQNYYLCERHQQVDVASVYRLLSEANLIADPKPTHVFQGEFKRFSIDLVDINIRGFFEKLQPFTRKIFKPLVLTTLVLIALGLASFRFEYLVSSDIFVVQDSYLLGYLTLLLIGPFLTLVHEFSHAFTAAAYGASPRHLKIAVYMLMPVFYTDIAGIYTLRPKDRIKVWIAGCYSNICIGSIMLLIYRVLSPHFPPDVGQIMLKVALGNFFVVIGNLFPLMPTDGYFIISTLIKQVNIRTNAFQEFFNWIRGQDNNLKGALLAYFLATSLIIVGGLIVQVLWIIGIFNELVRGSPNIQTFSHPIFLMVGLLLIVRVIMQIIAQIRKRVFPKTVG